MNAYKPNYNDPRVQARVRRALGFACGCLSSTKSRAWSTRYIDRYFGSQRNDISRYLRGLLLIETKSNWSIEKKECKEYRLNESGVEYLKEAIKSNNNNTYHIVVDLAQSDHQKELSTGDFTYTDKAHRLWHPLQRYRRQYKTQILADAGYRHQYDIACCAPTLIYQYAQKCGMDDYLFALRRYLTNRTQVREELAQNIELEPAAAKEIINALFAGAIISNNPRSDIYHILDGDRARIEYLKQDPFISALREDIKTCWQAIKPSMSRRSREVNGRERLLPITSKQKWNIYFELERVILNSVRDYLNESSVRHFLEHDGWSSEKELDIESLRTYIWNKTEYEVEIEYENLTIYNTYPIVVDLEKEQ